METKTSFLSKRGSIEKSILWLLLIVMFVAQWSGVGTPERKRKSIIEAIQEGRGSRGVSDSHRAVYPRLSFNGSHGDRGRSHHPDRCSGSRLLFDGPLSADRGRSTVGQLYPASKGAVSIRAQCDAYRTSFTRLHIGWASKPIKFTWIPWIKGFFYRIRY